MGVMGAFVFAAQMINFSLPGMPGTSGHLGGGVLLAIILGPSAAIVTMAGILIVQCLLFQDGGLLALGCNIINMGIVPCLAGWGIYRLIGSGQNISSWRLYLGTWLACTVAVTAGAVFVPLEAALSGVLRVPVLHFEAMMIGVHLVIGLIEGLITFAVVAYLRQVRPAALSLAQADESRRGISPGALGASILATALLLAGVVSWFASRQPDGLEWSYLVHKYGQVDNAVAEPAPAVASVNTWQDRWSLMPDYTHRSGALGAEKSAQNDQPAKTWPIANGWGSLAGIAGTLVTLALLYGASILLKRRQKAAAPATEPSDPA
jgi:cobalt/nickel transport system permease protein